LAAVPEKRKAEIKKQTKEFAEFHSPEFDRVLPLDSPDVRHAQGRAYFGNCLLF